MVLTEEQIERIRKNRERALQIQKERREKQEREQGKTRKNTNNGNDENNPLKKQKTTKSNDSALLSSSSSSIPTTTPRSNPVSKTSSASEDNNGNEYHSSEPLEESEEGASEWVTKTEAMNMYCLPEGSMAVCSFEERENPRNPLFKPMKLYRRSEIRYRAHKRHGGLEGLVKERNRRRKRKLDKDMEAAMDIFK